MSQKKGIKVVGARGPIYWLLIAIAVIVVAAVAVVVLVIVPQITEGREEQARLEDAARHYEAGVVFQDMADWAAAEGEYMQVIGIDAAYKDVQTRLAEVKARLAESADTATAAAIAQAEQARVDAENTAAAQTQATATAQVAAVTATAVELEAQYQRGLGYINLAKWEEAQAELQRVFAVDPNYKDVQAKLAEVEANLAEMSVPTATSTPSPEEPTATPTPVRESVSSEMAAIPFSDTAAADALSSDWSWTPGASESSSHRLDPETGALTLITGPGTDLWGDKNSAPRVEYPLSGDFRVQVRLSFNPTEKWQVAGLGLRSKEEPGTWLAVRRVSGGGSNQTIGVAQTLRNRSEGVVSIPYAKTVAYLRIERIAESLSFAVSENGVNWIDLKTDHVFALPDQVQLFLFVYSTSSHGILSEFSDVRSGQPQGREASRPQGMIAFGSTEDPAQLDGAWGWFPGGSQDSKFVLADGKLSLITGPGTDLWDNRNSAPCVEQLVAGDFEVEVRLDFAPTERWQVAGLGLRSSEERGNWIVARRVSSGGSNQTIAGSAMRNYDSEGVASLPYAGTTVHFRIQRVDPLISLFYSSDGANWEPIVQDFVMGMPERVWLFMFVYSTSGNGITATFSDLNATTG